MKTREEGKWRYIHACAQIHSGVLVQSFLVLLNLLTFSLPFSPKVGKIELGWAQLLEPVVVPIMQLTVSSLEFY